MVVKFRNMAVLPVLAALAACQSDNVSNVLRPDGSASQVAAAQTETISQDELEAYCPQASLRENTGYFRTYTKGGEDNPDQVIYQASIEDVTRNCRQSNGTLTINVAAKGRIVPGPAGSAGTITMPIRVAIIDTQGTVYSNLTSYPVQVASTSGATQFIFNESNIQVPIAPGQRMRVYVGYDEGPYQTP